MKALVAAGELLVARGFSAIREDYYSHPSFSTGKNSVELRVVLPPEFPDCLPKLKVEPGALGSLHPHVDSAGTVCIAPPDGTLIDGSRPAGVIDWALDAARRVLAPLAEERADAEIRRELTSYFGGAGGPFLLFAARADDQSRAVLAAVEGKRRIVVVADGVELLDRWSSVMIPGDAQRAAAYYVVLEKLPTALLTSDTVTLGTVLDAVRDCASPETNAGLVGWMKSHGPPVVLVLGVATPEGGFAVLSLEIPEPTAGEDSKALRGFRPGRVPPVRTYGVVRGSPVTKLHTNRVDSDYQQARTGMLRNLIDKAITIVGCGSVGSHVAIGCVKSGVRRLRLVDMDLLAADNLGRHALGPAYLWQNKAEGLAKYLRRMNPNCEIESEAVDVREILAGDATSLKGEILVLATGNQTLELSLNDAIRGGALTSPDAQVHVWIEPYGLAIHVFIANPALPGCYRCLFDRSSEVGLFCEAHLSAPAQQYALNVGGCSTAFMPFGIVDSTRAAELCIDTVARAGAGEEFPLLSTLCVDRTEFLARGFHLSRRGAALQDGTLHRQVVEPLGDCPSCRG